MTLRLLAPLLLLAVATACPAHEGQDFTPSTQLQVSGAVRAARSFDLAALQQLIAHDTGPAEVICASGVTTREVENYRGVRLTDVIDATGLGLSGHRDGRRLVVVARATDGYIAVFSWSELYNSDIGPDVVVAWEKDGEPLTARDGQLLLVSGRDTRTGPRHVRNLSQIEILPLQ